MKISLLRLLTVVVVSLLSGTALANPVAIIMKLSAEVTGDTHVRLRYLTNYGSNPNLITYGTGHSEWFTTGDTISLDAGSGARTMNYQYMCDCHVPTGAALTYQVLTSMSGGFSPRFPAELTVTVTPAASTTTLCDDKCAQADSRDAGADASGGATGGSTATDTAGSSTGSTSATGGSTAASTATAGPSTGGTSAVVSTEAGAGGSSPSVPATTAGGGSTEPAASTGNASEDKKGGACSFSSHARGGVISLFLALGLMALGWRRRR